MRNSLVLLSWLLLLATAVEIGNSAPPVTVPPVPGIVPAASAPSDSGTDVVVLFYKALLQDGPPTLDQEKAIFNDFPEIRAPLVSAGYGTDQDPVVLLFFRKNKDLFLPKNMKTLKEVQISSTLNWVRSLDHLKEVPKLGSGYVLALFLDDAKAPAAELRFRTIVFDLSGGKINCDLICLDGFGSKGTQEMIAKILKK